MAKHEGYASQLVTADALVTGKPAVLVRAIPHASVDGGDVTIYNGRGTDGRSQGQLHGLANQVLGVEFGVLCEEGIYVDVGSDLTSVLIVYDPVDEP